MRGAASTPTVGLAVDGEPLDPSMLGALASVRVARRLSVPAQCEVAFALDHVTAASVADLSRRARIGSRIEVAVEGDPGVLFTGDVTAHEWQHEPDGRSELRLRAYDELHRLRKRQQVMARTDASIAELAAELAAEAGLSAEVDGGVARWPVLVQHAQSDLDLLVTLGERGGLYGVVDGGVLRLVDLGGFGEPVRLHLHDTLLSARVEATADPACRSVTVTGWDPVTAEVLAGRADRPRAARPPDERTGPQAVGTSGERFLAGHHGPSADQLDLEAQAELDRRVAAERVVSGIAVGDDRLVPGRRIDVTGVDEAVEGTYVLTATTHTIDGAGYLVALDTAPPPSPRRHPASDATVGEVISADDPHGLGRVRVRLPAYGDVETDWREVVAAGAGRGKGMVLGPDEGDRVLVVLPGGDPASAVVVGGLYGAGGPADAGVVGGRVQRWSVATRGGQRIIFDDEGSQLVLADRTGSAVVLAPDRVTLHAAADLVIEAPGRTITFRADRVDMTRVSSTGGAPSLPPPHADRGA